MRYLITIVLYRGLGQPPGILTCLFVFYDHTFSYEEYQEKIKIILAYIITLQSRPLAVLIYDLHDNNIWKTQYGVHKIKHAHFWPKLQTS